MAWSQLQMCTNTLQQYTSIHRCCSTINPSSSSSSMAITWSSNTCRRLTTKPIILCQASSINEVEVVTACSWTELVVAADMPVLVILWAPHCEPCRMMSLTVDEVSKEYAGKALCYKLNIEEYPNVATQYEIKNIPTMLFYKHGENKERLIGVVSKSTICSTLDKYVD